MRLVQQIAAMLAAIIAKRRAGHNEEAKHDIAATALRHIGLSLDAVKPLSPDALASYLETSGANRHFRSILLAELLIQDAEILEAEGQAQQALPGYVHAFCLLADSISILTGEEQKIYGPKLDMLAARLERLPSNPYTSDRILAYRKATSG